MSIVTNIIISIGNPDDWYVAMENIRFGAVGNELFTFNQLDQRSVGGTKALEAHLLIGAFNHFPLVDFVQWMNSLPWKEPFSIQIFVKEENYITWTMMEYKYIDGFCPINSSMPL